MTIVTLHKITLCGPLADKPATLEALQNLGCLHLTPLRPPPPEPESAPAPQPRRTEQALRHLLDCPQRRRQVQDWQDFDRQAVVELALTNRHHSRELTDRRDFLLKRIREMEPWGDFQLPPLAELAGYRLWFYVVPHYQLRQIDPRLVWQEVARDQRNAYVVVIAPDEPDPRAVPVPRAHLGALSLTELRERLEKVEIRLEELAAERQALTRWLALLLQCLAAARDRATLEWAGEQTLERDGLFAIQGWAPVARLGEIESLAEKQGLALLVEAPAAQDRPPTLLNNPEELAGGQEVVAFYQMPGYRTWDPSPVIFLSFALFFAMILADAGYALVLGGVLLASGRKLAASTTGRRVKRMGWVTVALSLVYGVLSGGYFGVGPPPGTWLARLDVLDLNDFDAMMHLSVAVGVVHLMVANGLSAWRERHRLHALAPLGWILILAGGYLWWRQAAFGLWLAGVGVVLVFLFSGRGRLVSGRDWLWRGLTGLQALTGLSRAFGDVLSYLRLFALGLASASLAVTFNQLAFDTAARVPGLGVLLAGLILLAGHLLNFTLCVVSGVVHGLRLNLIEFYNWGISDEGYPFKAFARQEREPWKH